MDEVQSEGEREQARGEGRQRALRGSKEFREHWNVMSLFYRRCLGKTVTQIGGQSKHAGVPGACVMRSACVTQWPFPPGRHTQPRSFALQTAAEWHLRAGRRRGKHCGHRAMGHRSAASVGLVGVGQAHGRSTATRMNSRSVGPKSGSRRQAKSGCRGFWATHHPI
jgi:hypothetical protein